MPSRTLIAEERRVQEGEGGNAKGFGENAQATGTISQSPPVSSLETGDY